jgi:hypothetical protein
VFSPPGHLIGYIEQKWTVTKPKLDVKDHEGNIYAVIQMEPVPCPCCEAEIGCWTWMCRKNRIFVVSFFFTFIKVYLNLRIPIAKCIHIHI